METFKVRCFRAQHYGFAVFVIVLALLPQWLTGSESVRDSSALLLLGALALSAGYGGVGSGLLATLLATGAYEFWLLPPVASYTLDRLASVGQVGLLFVEGILLSLCIGRLRVSYLLAEQHRKLLTSVLDTNPNVICIKDKNGKFRLANRALADLFGVSVDTMIGKTAADFCSNPAEIHQSLQDDREVLTTGHEKLIAEEKLSNRTGSEHWFQTVKRPLQLDDGETLVLAIGTEITVHKHMEKALQAANRWTFTILESITDGFAAFDTHWRYRYVNQRAAELLQKPRDYLIGKCIWDEFPHISGTRFEQEYHRAVAEQITIAFEEYYRPFNIWFEIRAYPFADGLLVYFKDITDRKQAEEKIHFQARLLSTVEHAIIATDLTGAITYWNHSAEVLFGWPATDVLGRNVLTVTPAEPADQLADGIMPRLQCGERWSGEVLLRRRDGSTFLAIVTSAPIYDSSGVLIGIVGSSTDITARAQIQQALEQANTDLENRVATRTAELAASKAVLQSILDYTPALIYIITVDGRMEFANAEWYRVFGPMWGYSIAGRHLTELVPSESAAIFFQENEAMLASGKSCMTFENDMELPDGLHTFLRIKFPLRDSSGKIYAFCGVSLDITERKQNEKRLHALMQQLQQQNDQLEEVSRLKSEFLTQMSHELRTPLTSILGFSSVLLQQIFGPLTPKQQEYLSRLRSSGEHLLGLINDLLDLAKIEAGRLELNLQPVSVAELCQEAIQMVEVRSMAKQQQLSLELPTAVEELVCDRQRILQILLNYLSNAVKFTPEGGSITLTTRLSIGHEWRLPNQGINGDRRIMPPDPQAQFLVLQVNDTGTGVPEDKQHLLFQMFQQIDRPSSQQADGTGLGLALTRHLAELHGGTVTFSSIAGKGSQFAVWLPV